MEKREKVKKDFLKFGVRVGMSEGMGVGLGVGRGEEGWLMVWEGKEGGVEEEGG